MKLNGPHTKNIIFVTGIIIIIALIAGNYFFTHRTISSPVIYYNIPPGGAPVVSPSEAAQLSGLVNGNYTMFVVNQTTNETPQEWLYGLNEHSYNTSYPNFSRYITGVWEVGYRPMNVLGSIPGSGTSVFDMVISTNNTPYIWGYASSNFGNWYKQVNGTFDGVHYLYMSGMGNNTAGTNDKLNIPTVWFDAYDGNIVFEYVITNSTLDPSPQLLSAVTANALAAYYSTR